MAFEEFSEQERRGWGDRAGVYADSTARATTQSIPALLAAARVFSGASRALLDCVPNGLNRSADGIAR